jgi:hypothetical protein
VADELERWLEGKPIQARPVGRVERARRWCKRRPAVASLAAALVLTVAIAFATVLILWRHAERTRRDAEVSRDQAQHLLNESLQVNLIDPFNSMWDGGPPSLESLRKLEARCRGFLARRPDDTELRMALTGVLCKLAVI